MNTAIYHDTTVLYPQPGHFLPLIYSYVYSSSNKLLRAQQNKVTQGITMIHVHKLIS